VSPLDSPSPLELSLTTDVELAVGNNAS